MLPAAVNAPTPDQPVPPPADVLLAMWRARQADTGRGNPASDYETRRFLDRWPDPQSWAAEPLDEQLLGEVLAIFAPVKNLGHTEGLPENN